ncbi:hypothetical protein ACVWZ4_007109 [Bradyrhizobium sp. USDA 4472]
MHRGRRRGSRSDKALQKKRAAGTGGYVAWLICGSSRAVFTCTQRSHAAPAVEIAWRQQGSPCSRKSCHCPHCSSCPTTSWRRRMHVDEEGDADRLPAAQRRIGNLAAIKIPSSSVSPVEAKQPVAPARRRQSSASTARSSHAASLRDLPNGDAIVRFIGAMLLDQDTPATPRRHNRLLTLAHLKIAYHT